MSFLIPPLSERYVAEQTLEAVLFNKNQVLLPRVMYLLYFVNSVMPIRVSEIINKALGVDKAMDKVVKRIAATKAGLPPLLNFSAADKLAAH